MGMFSSFLGGAAEAAGYRAMARQARGDKRAAKAGLASLESNRQQVINPYSNVSNLSSLAKDLTGNLSNPFANLSVSTAAADMQAEQTDIALANTLDTIRATGGGAGGATALAQAALQGKQGVSASIEQQEASNEKAKAQGQQTLEQLQNSESARVQGIQLSEGRRIQDAEISGKDYQFKAQERRDESNIKDFREQRNTASSREYSLNKGAVGAAASAIGSLPF